MNKLAFFVLISLACLANSGLLPFYEMASRMKLSASDYPTSPIVDPLGLEAINLNHLVSILLRSKYGVSYPMR